MIKILENEPLSRHTTWRIGGPARRLVLPQTIADLEELAELIRKSGDPYFVIGNGSNLLASDDGFPGWIVKTTELGGGVEFLDGDRVRCGAGVLNNRLLRVCADRGLWGLEFLSGVPGTLGGAVAMNAGTSRDWIESVLLSVETWSFSGGRRELLRSQLRFDYRENHFLGDDELVISAEIQLKRGAPEEIRVRLGEMARRRKEAQPIELPSCGSVFRNPSGHNAWKLIEEAGLRGMRKGGAEISAKHCNFIVNNGGATAADVRYLIDLAKDRVKERCGIELHEELKEIGLRWIR